MSGADYPTWRDFLLREAYDGAFTRSPASIITRVGVPSGAQLTMKEAFGK